VSGSRHASPSSSSDPEGTTSTDATSVDEDTIVVQPKPPVKPRLIRRTRVLKKKSPLEQAKSGDQIIVAELTNLQHPAVQEDQTSVLSELASDMEFDDSTMTITSKQRKSRNKKRLPRPTTDIDHAPAIRIPGDYVLTSSLLAEPASAWINCKICEEPFVQKDAYFTRSSCPRCERHSKLYGYMWPKTDKEGKHDDEERVTDHRTVHRFIEPSEEKIIRKRMREESGSRSGTRERSDAVEEKAEEMEKGRRSKRPRTKKDRYTL